MWVHLILFLVSFVRTCLFFFSTTKIIAAHSTTNRRVVAVYQIAFKFVATLRLGQPQLEINTNSQDCLLPVASKFIVRHSKESEIFIASLPVLISKPSLFFTAHDEASMRSKASRMNGDLPTLHWTSELDRSPVLVSNNKYILWWSWGGVWGGVDYY